MGLFDIFKKRPKGTSEVVVYAPDEISAVENYITEKYGEYTSVYHEIYSPDIHVDICIIPPSVRNDFYTLVTMGMGARKMEAPPELANMGVERAELVIYLPGDWEIRGKEEEWYWPLRLLKSVARLPIINGTWLGNFHSIDNVDAFAPNTKLCGTMLLDESGDAPCILPNDEKVRFYRLLPLYREEIKYKIDLGADKLLEIMDISDKPVSINRESFCPDYDEYNCILDWAERHINSIKEKELPIDEICVFNHMAIYLRRCIELNLMSDAFDRKYPDMLSRCKSGLREFIRDELNGELDCYIFGDRGREFAKFYYSGEDICFPADVDDCALQYFGEERYNSEEFKDEAYLFVPFDEDYYLRLRKYFDKRYEDWLNT